SAANAPGNSFCDIVDRIRCFGGPALLWTRFLCNADHFSSLCIYSGSGSSAGDEATAAASRRDRHRARNFFDRHVSAGRDGLEPVLDFLGGLALLHFPSERPV